MSAKLALERMAYSPGEFAELFGKSQTWGYRQIYAGKVTAITEHGRILIPRVEVDAILKTAGIYDGLKSKAAKTKAKMRSLAKPEMQNAWQSFLAARRQAVSQQNATPSTTKSKMQWPASASRREAALVRLTRKRSGEKGR